MEQLISMRQRIKSIETIKKITNAMRLISMSMHARLRNKKTNLEAYKDTFYNLWSKIDFSLKNSFKEEKVNLQDKNNLIVIVGSQKGLCGTFNSNLFKFIQANYNISKKDYIVSVGKYAANYLKQNKISPFESFDNFSSTNFIQIAHAITDIILTNINLFSSVIFFSSYSKTFFVQEPRKTLVYPFKKVKKENLKIKKEQAITEYIFDQPVYELKNTIKQLTLSITIQDLLFESLLSEQAARFLSMDTATRNADNLLTNMKIEYNKLRQAAITRELIELTSSFI